MADANFVRYTVITQWEVTYEDFLAWLPYTFRILPSAVGHLLQIVIVIKSGGIRFKIRPDHWRTQVWIVPLKLSV